MARQRSRLFESLLSQGAAEFLSDLIALGRSFFQAITAAAVRFFGFSSPLSAEQTRALNRVATVARRMQVGPEELRRMLPVSRIPQYKMPTDPSLPDRFRYILSIVIRCPGLPDQYRTAVWDFDFNPNKYQLMQLVSDKRERVLKADSPDFPSNIQTCLIELAAIRGAYRRS